MNKMDINGEHRLVECALDKGSYKRTVETTKDTVSNHLPTGFNLNRNIAQLQLNQ